jgi:hypothetical protein
MKPTPKMLEEFEWLRTKLAKHTHPTNKLFVALPQNMEGMDNRSLKDLHFTLAGSGDTIVCAQTSPSVGQVWPLHSLDLSVGDWHKVLAALGSLLGLWLEWQEAETRRWRYIDQTTTSILDRVFPERLQPPSLIVHSPLESK